MRVLIDLGDQVYDREIDRYRSTTTVAQLITAAGGPELAAASTVFINSTAVLAQTPLSEITLLEATVIALTPQIAPAPVRGWSISVSGGLSAGTIRELPAQRPLTVGRSPQADITLATESASWQHCSCEIEGDGVRVRDAGSTNGTLVAGVPTDAQGILVHRETTLTVGGTSLLLRPQVEEDLAPEPGSLHNLTPAGTAPFNRPPRPGRPANPEPLTPPTSKEVPASSKFSMITVVAPLILAGVMVVVLGDARFAMFAALSPLMAVGMWYEQKHRRTKNVREEETRFLAALRDFGEAVDEAGAVEAQHRRTVAPDPAIITRRAALPSTQLWERRSGSEDFLILSAGTGDVPWSPPLEESAGRPTDRRVREVSEEAHLVAAPVLVDLSNAGVVGIVGDREGALALARNLVTQAAVHCGPADLTLSIFCDRGRQPEWSWASWLPHTRQLGSSSGERWLSDERQRSLGILRHLQENIDELPSPALLLVVDSDVLTEGRDAPARTLLGHGRVVPGVVTATGSRRVQVSGIVLASSADQLPASCTTIITVGDDATATVREPGGLLQVDDVILAGISAAAAQRCAQDLARCDDPELNVPGASLPTLVRLPELLGRESPDAAMIRALWSSSTGYSTPIGAGESGTLSLDLVADGPHGLVGGTTGSGKSEFLRSLVAGLAARNDATRLNFILIDFKGGAAFQACERLPHTIGTISNLDAQLADRALRSLEAEMQRRQRIFAEAGEGIDNLDAYLATGPSEPLPRLLLIVDEFAMLAKDFPEVLSSLVSVAAVGRTLGVHMILATQRPAGVVNDDILANTNLRVALRVQSREDSSNVIGVPVAASIGRAQSGRAFIKLGQDDITPVQTALVTGRAPQEATTAVDLREVNSLGIPAAHPPAIAATASDPSDLDLLIEAIVAAHQEAGFPRPREVWPEALGPHLCLAGYGAESAETTAATGTAAVSETAASETTGPISIGAVEGESIMIALADEPELQRQSPAGWDRSEGNLLLMGIAGSGTSTTLASIALTAAAALSPEDLDILVLDMGSRKLAPLEDLPHTVAYVGSGPGASEQQARFLRHLRAEMDQRRSDPDRRQPTLVLLDGLAALRDEFQDQDGLALLDILYRAYAEGPALGLWCAISTTRAKTVPSAIDEVTTQKWLFRLADPYDYSSLGVHREDIPASVPGRCVNAATLRQMQVAVPEIELAEAVHRAGVRWACAPRKPAVIGRLPETVSIAGLGMDPITATDPWRLPLGLREEDLEAAIMDIYEGEHALIAGPARSGKSSLLVAIAQSLRAAQGEGEVSLPLWGVCDRRSPLRDAPLDRVAVGPQELPALIAALRMESGPVLLFVDDAERFDDADRALADVLARPHSPVRVIAAGRAAELRGLYSHWTMAIRKSRCGVLLQPDFDYDGALFSTSLPRRAPVAVTPGRGYLCMGGSVALMQAMTPSTRVG